MLTNGFGEHYFEALNGATFQNTAAAEVFQQNFQDVLFQEAKFYIIIGTDSGLLPQYIQQHGPAKRSIYLFIELDDWLTQVQLINPDSYICGEQKF